MTFNKPVAIILGGTFPHSALIEKLKNRGYYTILIDYLDFPPAKLYADKHLKESSLDKEKVLQIARDEAAELIISTCIDQANVTACYVAEKLGLFAPYSYQTALNVTNKLKMKKTMLGNSIPTSNFIEVFDISDCEKHNLKFPLIVKPTDSNGSKGVRRANDQNELRQFTEAALKISRSKGAVIEEFKFGREIGVDCYVQDHEVSIIMTRERKKINNTNDTIQQIYGSFWPADLSTSSINEMKSIASNICKAFNLNNTPLMIQSIINDDDEINVIEFAPRIGGGENYKIIELQTGFDIIDAAINSFLNIPVSINFNSTMSYLFDNYIYSNQGYFGYVSGFEELLEKKEIEYFNIYKKKGSPIGGEITSANRIGVFAVKSDSKHELIEKIKQVTAKIEVYDINGKPYMRKDIYNNIEV